MAIPLKLAAGRYKLSRVRPYVSSALWAMIPCEAPGLGTLAVDKHWRLYYDPKIVEEWDVQSISNVLYHEIGHLLRGHCDRAERLGATHDWMTGTRWNISADCEINDDIVAEGLKLPDFYNESGEKVGNCCYPVTYGLEDGQFAEEYYAQLEDKLEYTVIEVEIDGGGGSSANDDSGPGSAGAKPPPSSGKNVRRIRVKIKADGTTVNQPDCGSCADGKKRDYEKPEPTGNGENETPAISKQEAESIRREVARQILEAAKQRGVVPGGWERWANEILTPKVNWKRALPAAIRSTIGTVSGCVDYYYNRPARRQSVFPDVVLPSLRRPKVRGAILVDTSGSMDDHKVAQCLAEINGAVKSTGGAGDWTVLFVDAAVHAVKQVFDAKRLVPIGGGGTDMRVGISYAENTMKPRPEVLIVLTDAETPWPETPPKGMKVIVGRMGTGSCPAWATTIHISD